MINIENIIRPNILKLKGYSSARSEYTGKEGIFVDANENPFGQLNRYPDPYQKQLKQQLAALKSVDTNNIFVGNGSDEVIDLAFRIFCNPGVDKALTFSPTYGMYDVSAAINDITLEKVALTESFQIDLETVKPFLSDKNLKLIFICSPNNPTGNLLDKNTIEYILNNFNGIVIVDEAYIDFASEESLIKWVNQYNNLIVSQTFSKAWGLAAARVGVAYANQELIALYNKVKPPYNVSVLNQKAAIEALENQATYQANLKSILAEKENLIAELKQLDLVQKIYPTEANFVLLEVTDADYIYNTLINKQIITRNRNKEVKNCIRITVGTPSENKSIINALKNIS